MGNNLDICSNGRAESENNMKDMQGKGSNTLDNRNITSDLQSILTSNRSGTRSSTRSSRSGSTSSRSKAMQSNWTSREEKMQLLASKLSQSDNNKSRKVNEISLMLSRHANTDYSSPENRTRSLTEARDSYSHSESWSKTKMLEESLCNPHTSSAEVMSRFEFLSVEERHLLYAQYLQRRPTNNKTKEENIKPLTSMEQSFIRSKLASSSLFSSFEKHDLDELIKRFYHERVASGTRIITEGDTKDRRFFLIKIGRFEIRRGQTVLVQVSSGVGIGELALFVSGRARGASVVALERAELFVCTPSAFWEVTAKSLATLKVRAIKAVRTVPSFIKLFGQDAKAIEEVAVKLFFKRFKPGDCILRRGHVGNAYYILLNGSVMIKGTDDHKKLIGCVHITGIKQMNAWTRKLAQTVFSNIFQLTDRKDDVTVRITDIKQEAIKKNNTNETEKSIHGILINYEIKNLQESLEISNLKNIELTKNIDWKTIFIKLKIEQDWSGTVSIVSPIQEQVNDDIILNTSGLTFGERSLLTDEPVSRDVVANGDHGETILVAGLTKNSFQQLPSNLLSLIEAQLVKEILSTHEVLSHLNHDDKKIVEQNVVYKSFQHQEYLIEENKSVDNLYIVRHGMCDITKLPHKKAARGEAVKIESNVTVNSVLGEVSLRENTNAGASVVARGPVTCYVFPKAIFNRYLIASPYLKKIATFRKKQNVKTIKLQSLTDLKHDDFTWEHPLVVHRELSTVRLVRHRATSGYFACRVIGIQFIERHKRHRRLVEERENLLTIHSQFCVKIISSFKDLRTIYILEEFCPGGTVLGLLNRQLGASTLQPTDAGNVLGCVVLGLRCCHDHNILVRALGPENLFIGINGKIKLANFEFSKKIMQGEFTMTVCGSHEFMPPEQMCKFWKFVIVMAKFCFFYF